MEPCLELVQVHLNTPPTLILGRKSVAGFLIGGIAETQEMLDFCGAHNIVSEIEIINMQEIYSVVLPSNFASCFDASSLVALTMPSL